MHPLQSHILKKLTINDSLRYTDLKPGGIESNRFVYHLKKLSDSGLLEKAATGYKLTAQGKRYVGRLSLANFFPRSQPKIVTVIVCKNPLGQYLLYKSRRQPFFNLYCFPFGKTHLGEPIFQAAERELKEKTGLTGKLTHRGDVYLVIREKGEIVSHMLCHVFSGTNPNGHLAQESALGLCQWQKIDRLKPADFVPGFLDIHRLLKSKGHFFKEIVV